MELGGFVDQILIIGFFVALPISDFKISLWILSILVVRIILSRTNSKIIRLQILPYGLFNNKLIQELAGIDDVGDTLPDDWPEAVWQKYFKLRDSNNHEFFSKFCIDLEFLYPINAIRVVEPRKSVSSWDIKPFSVYDNTVFLYKEVVGKTKNAHLIYFNINRNQHEHTIKGYLTEEDDKFDASLGPKNEKLVQTSYLFTFPESLLTGGIYNHGLISRLTKNRTIKKYDLKEEKEPDSYYYDDKEFGSWKSSWTKYTGKYCTFIQELR